LTLPVWRACHRTGTLGATDVDARAPLHLEERSIR